MPKPGLVDANRSHLEGNTYLAQQLAAPRGRRGKNDKFLIHLISVVIQWIEFKRLETGLRDLRIGNSTPCDRGGS